MKLSSLVIIGLILTMLWLNSCISPNSRFSKVGEVKDTVHSKKIVIKEKPEKQTIKEKLLNTWFPVEYKEMMLKDITNMISEKAGVEIEYSDEAKEMQDDVTEMCLDSYYPITKKVSAYYLLVSWFCPIFLENKIRVVTVEEYDEYIQSRNIIKFYYIADLFYEYTRNHPSLRLRIKKSQSNPPPKLHPKPDKIELLISLEWWGETIAEFTFDWHNENLGASRSVIGGYLIVRNTPEVHERIEWFLREMRKHNIHRGYYWSGY